MQLAHAVARTFARTFSRTFSRTFARTFGRPLHRSVSVFIAAAALAALTLPAAPAHAEPADGAAADDASVSSTPARRHAPADVGQLRDAALPAPTAGTVPDDATRPNERDVAPPAHHHGPLISADGIAELAARQLRKEARRHQRAIDACTTAAVRRHPTATGTVRLAFDVQDSRIGHVRVTDDTLRDAGLDACLTSVARRFRFSLDAAHVTWPIVVSPSAAR